MVQSIQDLWVAHKASPYDLSLFSDSCVLSYVPTCAGGTTKEAIETFYNKYFSPSHLTEQRVLRTSYDTNQNTVTEECVVQLTLASLPPAQELTLSWILPGAKWLNPSEERVITFPMVTIAEFGREDGLLREKRVFWDQAGVMKQAGLLTVRPGVWKFHPDYAAPAMGEEQVERLTDPADQDNNPLIERLVKGTISVKGTKGDSKSASMSSLLHGNTSNPPLRTTTRINRPVTVSKVFAAESLPPNAFGGTNIDPKRYETNLSLKFSADDPEALEEIKRQHEKAKRNRPTSAAYLTKSHLENGFVGADEGANGDVAAVAGGKRKSRPEGINSQLESQFSLLQLEDDTLTSEPQVLAAQVQLELGLQKKAHDNRSNQTTFNFANPAASGIPVSNRSGKKLGSPNGAGNGKEDEEVPERSFSGKRPGGNHNRSSINFSEPPPRERPKSRILAPPGGHSNVTFG